MKLWMFAALIAAAAAVAVPTAADAKRLAGGKSAGLQRNMPARTAPDAPPPKPAQAAQPAQAQPATPAAATPPAAAPKRNWMGPLAGLAAGLGLAALMSHFGMGEGLANVVMMALLAGGAVFLVMFLLRRFGAGAQRTPALAGAGAPLSFPNLQRTEPPMQRNAEPAALGSAVLAAPLAGGPEPISGVFVPAAFDAEGFARTAKMIFIRLQAAHDTADLDDLKRFTTPEMFASIRLDIQERGATPQHTDVLNVDAVVLDVAQEADRQVVSVRFHGQVVEERGGTPTAFNEVWHLVKPHDDSRPWAIAGIEQMT